MVRSFLDGRFENTAFCLLAPDGKERLSRSGRAPWMAFRTRREPRGNNSAESVATTVAELEKVAKKYKPGGDPKRPIVQDFHSFKQSLNVASGDQRLLLFVATKDSQPLKNSLRPILGDNQVIGRFHVDFAGETDGDWAEAVSGETSKEGLFIIRADKFGQKGEVVAQLPTNAKPEAIKATMIKANEAFAEEEDRKVYKDHVAEGRRERVEFKTNMPYGEDRDGDGKIDHRGGQRRRGR